MEMQANEIPLALAAHHTYYIIKTDCLGSELVRKN